MSTLSPSDDGLQSEHPSEHEQPTPDQRRIPLWIVPVAILVGLAGAILGQIIVSIIGLAFGVKAASPTPLISIVESIVFDLAFVASALYFAVLRGGWGPSAFGYRRIGWGLGVSGFVLGAIGYYAFSLAYGIAFNIHSTDKLPSSFGVHSSTAALAGTAAFVCVVAPICEEFFFRGFLFGVLREMSVTVGTVQLGPWLAAIIVGVLFGAAHTGSASSAQFLIPLGVLGFVLCLIRWRTGSLYPCMALHSFNNSIAMGVLLGWSIGPIVLLLIASWTVIALLTWPLSSIRTRVSLPVG